MSIEKAELQDLYKKDPYVYKNGTLKNKLGITDYEKLRQAEADISFIKLFTIDKYVKPEAFDETYLKAIHKYILEDIFDWAGDFRTVPVVKSEEVLAGDTVRYAHPDEIGTKLAEEIKSLNSINWNNKSLEDTVAMFTRKMSSIWQIHPFRDGNTRTVTAFATGFAQSKGFPLNPNVLLNNFGYLRKAFVWASQGKYSNYKYLENITRGAILSGREKSDNLEDREDR